MNSGLSRTGTPFTDADFSLRPITGRSPKRGASAQQLCPSAHAGPSRALQASIAPGSPAGPGGLPPSELPQALAPPFHISIISSPCSENNRRGCRGDAGEVEPKQGGEGGGASEEGPQRPERSRRSRPEAAVPESRKSHGHVEEIPESLGARPTLRRNAGRSPLPQLGDAAFSTGRGFVPVAEALALARPFPDRTPEGAMALQGPCLNIAILH
ncbi:uncharacterized protein LOC127548090 [Antechinus flavipes]|uniref:uncharacterized protein LOC127548090 n=1 Tax=Antechinus flavipes TaxID=38775 RepID=UPI002235C28F|nr:uncharacterized protein LOC127548090 [Antechinus flavipes]